MVALGEAPLEKWAIRNPGPSKAEAGSRETATRCRFESIRNSKIVRCHRPRSIILKNAVLAIGLTVRDMLHTQNKAASFPLINCCQKRCGQRDRPQSNKPKAL